MLIKIAEVFETSVSELLGAKIFDRCDKNNVAEQLSGINEQLAVRNRRTKLVLKAVLGIIIVFIVFDTILAFVSLISFNSFQDSGSVKVTQQVELITP